MFARRRLFFIFGLCRKSDPRCPGSKSEKGKLRKQIFSQTSAIEVRLIHWRMGSSKWGNVTRVETVSIGWQAASRPTSRILKKRKRLYISVRSYLQYLLYCFALSYHIPLCFLGLLCNNLYSFACYRCNHFGLSFYSFWSGLGVLLRITHYSWCRFFFCTKIFKV